MKPIPDSIDVQPLTSDRWDDLALLFGPNGAYGGCWCMYWRVSGRDFERLGSDGRRQALRELTAAARVPGLLAYLQGEPVGWCSVDRRAEYARLQRSPVLRPIDERPAMAITCFFVHRGHRKRGVTEALVTGAVEHARAAGVPVLEAYPDDRFESAAAAYMGVTSTFRRLGFEEAARRGHRPILRLELG